MLACPICAVPEGTQMTAGVRAGALVLIIVSTVVIVPLAAYGIRLWRSERGDR